jgi:hypothetical protein
MNKIAVIVSGYLGFSLALSAEKSFRVIDSDSSK